MSITLELLHLPAFLVFLLIVLISMLLSAVSTYLGRNFVKIKSTEAHNEFVGLMFSVVAGLYGLILAFVIFFVWEQLDDAQKTADMEGSHALEMYQDISYYPDSVKAKELKSTFLNYTHLVIEKEYPLMAVNKTSPITEKAFDKLCDYIGKLRVTNRGTKQDQIDPFSQNLLNDHMLKKLNEVTTYRNLRILSAGSDIPTAVWIPLLFGGLITLVFAIVLKIDNVRLHFIINGLLGCFIGVIFYLIIIIDHPYSGEIRIMPNTYQTILDKAAKDSLENNVK